MEFTAIKKGTHLSVDQMNAIYNNFQYIKEKLETAGFAVGTLLDNSVTYTIAPIDILDKFNNVERNIQTIHSVISGLLGHDEKFYKKFTWTPTTPNRKAEVWRWIDWLYNVKNINVFYGALCDIDNKIITDKNNQRIMILSAKEKQ